MTVQSRWGNLYDMPVPIRLLAVDVYDRTQLNRLDSRSSTRPAGLLAQAQPAGVTRTAIR